jgi:hypothetical protein
MKTGSLLGVVAAMLVAAGCRDRSFSTHDGADTEAAAAFVGFTAIEATILKARKDMSSELKANEKCAIKEGVKLATKRAPEYTEKHYKVEITDPNFNCGFKVGYVFSEHVKVSGGSNGSSFCQKSWEEAKGTTDYTTFDMYARKSYPSPDRAQNKTLVGSGVQKTRSLCEKARAIKHCFVRPILESDEASAKKFRAWAAAKNVNPMLALMAKTEQETKMGMIEDVCRGGNCNGIGIGQIITAVDANGIQLSDNDKRWEGITFNILTNLTYSVRVLALKTGQSRDLYDLAYYYNGSEHAAKYASNVVGFYKQLQGCGL